MNKYNNISYSLIENYLSVNGWSNAKRIDGEISIWETGSDLKQRVWVPLDTGFGDYEDNLNRVFDTLSAHEDRPETRILEDIETFVIGDILRVRSEDPFNRDASTLPLEDGILLMKKARDMVVYSACSAEKIKAIHPNYRSDTIKEYLDNVRIGQTEKGSYIVKVISPLPKEADAQEQQTLPHQEKPRPFERKVIETLMTALDTVKEIAAAAKTKGVFEPEPFIESVSSGVSANLCESIVRIKNNPTNMPLEVSVSWAYSPIEIDKNIPKQVSLPVNIMPYIQKAAEALREKEPAYLTIKGIVTDLHRGTKTGPGSITVGASIEGRPKAIHIELSEEDYQTAINAHGEGLEINCTGELIKGKKYTRLQDPSNFQILEDKYKQAEFDDM